MSCTPCKKAKGLADSLRTWAKDGMSIASQELRQKRLDACKTCDHYSGLTCEKCGCIIAVKARLATSNCPDGKW